MKKFDEMLHTAALNCMEKEDKLIEKEMEGIEKHVFSDEFNQKMDQLFADIDLSIARATKRKKRRAMLLKIAPIAAVFVIVISGLLITVNKNSVQASDTIIHVTSWCKEFFSFTNKKATNAKEFIFDESHINYIPEGFSKIEEYSSSSFAFYKYADKLDNYVYIKADYNDVSAALNNENTSQDLRISEDGLEYHFIKNTKTEELNIIFHGSNNLYYLITGNVSEEDMIRVMNGLTQ